MRTLRQSARATGGCDAGSKLRAALTPAGRGKRGIFRGAGGDQRGRQTALSGSWLPDAPGGL